MVYFRVVSLVIVLVDSVLPNSKGGMNGKGKFVWVSNDVVRTLSMWSIAGITVAKFGVPHEKKRVASLNIC